MGKLERAKIYALSGDGKSGSDKNADYGIDVCFNPKEYSLDKTLDWASEKAWSDAPNPEFKEPKPMTLSVTLQFDTYEERVSVRDKWVRKIEQLTLMKKQLGSKPSKKDKQDARPPVILFVWGRFTFKGVIESLGQKYTMFLSDGTPVRAECALKIRNVWDIAIDTGTSQDFSSTHGGASQTHTVKDGDRLDLIAAEKLGDAGRWPEIAALNDLDDPAVLKTNTTLKIPD
jgi:hypothetical protein